MKPPAYLADTHILLWAINDDTRMAKRHRELLESEAVVYASVASIWKIAIKQSLGRLRVPANLGHILPQASFPLLDIRPDHTEADLPLHHRDPFDRLLVVQAQIENLTVLSVDPFFACYDVALV